jgi:hypothetical protein
VHHYDEGHYLRNRLRRRILASAYKSGASPQQLVAAALLSSHFDLREDASVASVASG